MQRLPPVQDTRGSLADTTSPVDADCGVKAIGALPTAISRPTTTAASAKPALRMLTRRRLDAYRLTRSDGIWRIHEHRILLPDAARDLHFGAVIATLRHMHQLNL